MADVRWGRHAVLAGLAIIVSAGMLAGCGSGDERRPGAGADSLGTAAQERLSSPGTAVLVWCDAGEVGTQVTLAAVSMRDGRTVAGTSFGLPEQIEPSLPCQEYPPASTSPGWTRTMFDRSFQRMAVTVTDESTNAQRVSVVDVVTGTQAPLPSASEGFASTPKEGRGVFHPTSDELWFVDRATYQVVSRDPSSGRPTLHGKLPGDDATGLAVGERGYFPIESLQEAVVAPNGKYAIVNDQGEAYLVLVGTLPDDAPSIYSMSGPERAGSTASCDKAQSWLDDQNLLCDNSGFGKTGLALITFSPDRTSITGSRTDLLPETNRDNFSAVASPDGKSFAFLSLQGNLVTLYRQSLTPGSVPVKVTDIERPAMRADPDNPRLLPILLEWQ